MAGSAMRDEEDKQVLHCTRPAQQAAAARCPAMGAAAVGQPQGSSSSSPAQPCPLHACLLRYGITDLEAFNEPKHLALSQEEVSSNMKPKLAALAAEGLSPKQVLQIMRSHNTPLWCSYADTFRPNLQLLQRIVAHADHKPHPQNPHLTAAGTILTASPTTAAMYLSRDPSKVQQLLQWLEGSLGVGIEQLAACKDLCNALKLSAGAANAVFLSLQNQQVPAEQAAYMLVTQPAVFTHRPEVLSERIGALQQHLGLDAGLALKVAIRHPTLLKTNLESSLPPLLRFLDGYMGEKGVGGRLVRAQPALGTLRVEAAEQSVGRLAARGYSPQRIQRMISKQPTILTLNLDSPLQQQKLAWMDMRSPWPVEAFLDYPRSFAASTRRLAGRVALLRECGLQPGATPSTLATQPNASFLATVRQQLAGQGRELPWASWAEWEEAWLGTEEGKEWGFPPLKD
ncbi:hypothetical protein N2152v2_009945 [Parachlorella kessleri]